MEREMEAAFVDDEAFVLMAPTCKQLDEAVDKCLSIITSTFTKYGLSINWRPGKTEALLRYRDKNSAKALDRRRLQCGKVAIRLPPQCGEQLLSVGDCYMHLGGMVCVSGNNRSSSALATYTPIAARVFGNRYILEYVKMSFVNSLIYSRLLFNCQVWEAIPNTISKLGGVQSRAFDVVAMK